jgi:hypothetical protein
MDRTPPVQRHGWGAGPWGEFGVLQKARTGPRGRCKETVVQRRLIQSLGLGRAACVDGDIIYDVTWSVEMEPEVELWLESLSAKQFASAASRIDYLSELGSAVRMPRSRPLGSGLFELRFDVDRTAVRITYFFPGDRRIVLLTVFRKQRQNERAEVERARRAMATCVERGHTADEEDQ